MRYIVIFSLLLFSGTVVPRSDEKGLQESKYVGLKILLKQKELKPGETANLFISFKPRKGIQINSNPPVELKIDSTDVISSIDKPELPKSNKGDYFDVGKPIRQSFTLSKNLKPGNILLKGTLTYFFCSDSEGWCRKFKHPIIFKVKIIK